MCFVAVCVGAAYIHGLSNYVPTKEYIAMVDKITPGLILFRINRDENGMGQGTAIAQFARKSHCDTLKDALTDDRNNHDVIGGKKLVADVSIYEYKIEGMESKADGRNYMADSGGKDEYLRPVDGRHGNEGFNWYNRAWITWGVDSDDNNGAMGDICREEYPNRPLEWIADVKKEYLKPKGYSKHCQVWINYNTEENEKDAARIQEENNKYRRDQGQQYNTQKGYWQ